MSVIKKVVLVGASGNLGAIILPALVAERSLQVTVLTRPTNTLTFPEGVTVIRTAFEELELAKALEGQDAVISSVGATGFQDQKILIDAAIRARVKRFIPSEFSSNTMSPAVRQLVPVFEPKKAILDYLKEKESTGLTWTGIAVGALFDWGLRSGFLGFDLANKKATIWDGGDKTFSLTNQSDVGKAVVGVLAHPSETANQYLYVATVTTTQKDILDLLESQSKIKWKVQNVTTEQQLTAGRELISKGDFTGMFMLVQAAAWGSVPGIRSAFPVDETLANATLGVPEGNMNETIKAVLKV
ncbi:isoflavone reductase family protein [Stagonosporopsis vannaccii]|nr:isoflavone reductase family protein [Stagonosporopsis vannaccii]